jgi:hypothetical protein
MGSDQLATSLPPGDSGFEDPVFAFQHQYNAGETRDTATDDVGLKWKHGHALLPGPRAANLSSHSCNFRGPGPPSHMVDVATRSPLQRQAPCSSLLCGSGTGA